jgi:hypothetical protein
MARAEPRGPFSRDYFRLLGFPKAELTPRN